jgi:hypothetical protein
MNRTLTGALYGAEAGVAAVVVLGLALSAVLVILLRRRGP